MISYLSLKSPKPTVDTVVDEKYQLSKKLAPSRVEIIAAGTKVVREYTRRSVAETVSD